MHNIIRSLIILLALNLSACSKDHTQNPGATEQPKGVLTDTQTKALDQAKALQETLDKTEAARRKQIE